jgi:hypothetical protein
MMRQGAVVTPNDVLAIFPGARILSAEEAAEIKAEQADWDAIESERAGWYLDGETWRKAPAPIPELGTKCEVKGCGGNIVERTWPDRVDRGCHKCGKAAER